MDDFYPRVADLADLPPLSSTALESVQQTVRLAAYNKISYLNADAVFLAAYDRGNIEAFGVAGFMVDALRTSRPTSNRSTILPFPPGESYKTPSAEDSLSYPGVTGFLKNAEDIRALVGDASEIRFRHLLAAAAENGVSDKLLQVFDLSPLGLQALIRLAVKQALGPTVGESWNKVLDVEPGIDLSNELTFWNANVLSSPETFDGLGGGTSSDSVDARLGIPIAQDALDVGNYASMLGSIIARKSTPMPLSVGLFGEWGSGKSYFMALVRSEVSKYGQTDGDTHHGEVVQIGFNAWSYADSNLWASLGDEIFAQLAGRSASPDSDDAERRERIRTEIATSGTRARELASDRTQAEERIAELTARRSVELNDVIKTITHSERLRNRLSRVWKHLGVSDTATKVHLLMEQGAGVVVDVKHVRNSLSPLAVWIITIGLFIALGSIAVVLLFGDQDAIRKGMGVALTSVTLSLPTAVIVMKWTSSAAATLADVVRDIQSGNEVELAAAIERVRVLDHELFDTESRIRDLANEMSELSPGNRFYAFLAERVRSDDYRGQLGLVATIRRDLEKLAALQDQWRKERQDIKAIAGSSVPKPIDRIVLYIDDLDRCSPDQVVDVLDAVHLLLATDLFVVVVGVDPLWVMQALRRRHIAAFGVGDSGGMDAMHKPEGYLEKIFNIPFYLPTMTPSSFSSLIRTVAEEGDSRANLSANDPELIQPLPAPDARVEDARVIDDRLSFSEGDASKVDLTQDADDSQLPREGVKEAMPESDASTIGRAHAKARPLTSREIDMLEHLAGSIRSPREAKRLMNIYRMLRSTQSLSSTSTFLDPQTGDGDYQAVVLMLGVVSATPHLLQQFCWTPETDTFPGGVCVREDFTGWGSLIDGLRPRYDREKQIWRNDVVELESPQDKKDWTDLAIALTPVGRHLTMPDLSALRHWSRHVARFSFIGP
ncbi:P-loop NTPase fold protein [Clavibacter michiganensis]|uniref:P-loop NTPase fold protein n=1 Tax=Clavibacter michiganensis TaxID=28447 RepID=UPI001557768E|nr:P-loop NTPase fold protein [Clavibacter michiganensis]